MLDLERLARHRGSLLGDLPDDPQPSQKRFESALYAAMSSFDVSRPGVRRIREPADRPAASPRIAAGRRCANRPASGSIRRRRCALRCSRPTMRISSPTMRNCTRGSRRSRSCMARRRSRAGRMGAGRRDGRARRRSAGDALRPVVRARDTPQLSGAIATRSCCTPDDASHATFQRLARELLVESSAPAAARPA